MNSPAEVAKNYIAIGKNKANMNLGTMFVLAIFAGIFIGLAGVGASTASVSIQSASVAKLVGAMLFPAGLSMTLIAGSELFTGNCLLVIPLMEKQITVLAMLKNWVVVYLGNFVGGLLVAAIVVYGNQIGLFDNQLAVATIGTAVTKCSLPFGEAVIKGIGCNFLVCIAVWMAFAAKDVVGKVAALYLPILIFVLAGFEHNVANMFYIGAGLLAKNNPVYLQAALDAGKDVTNLTWSNFLLGNELPVTIGNIIGGSVLVGLGYWFAYLRGKK